MPLYPLAATSARQQGNDASLVVGGRIAREIDYSTMFLPSKIPHEAQLRALVSRSLFSLGRSDAGR
jgi:hypothetical protein